MLGFFPLGAAPLAGTGVTTAHVDGAATLPMFTAAASGTLLVQAVGGASLPVFAIDGAATVALSGNGAVVLPTLTPGTLVTVLPQTGGIATLPALGGIGAGLGVVGAQGAILLPSFALLNRVKMSPWRPRSVWVDDCVAPTSAFVPCADERQGTIRCVGGPGGPGRTRVFVLHNGNVRVNGPANGRFYAVCVGGGGGGRLGAGGGGGGVSWGVLRIPADGTGVDLSIVIGQGGAPNFAGSTTTVTQGLNTVSALGGGTGFGAAAGSSSPPTSHRGGFGGGVNNNRTDALAGSVDAGGGGGGSTEDGSDATFASTGIFMTAGRGGNGQSLKSLFDSLLIQLSFGGLPNVTFGGGGGGGGVATGIGGVAAGAGGLGGGGAGGVNGPGQPGQDGTGGGGGGGSIGGRGGDGYGIVLIPFDWDIPFYE